MEDILNAPNKRELSQEQRDLLVAHLTAKRAWEKFRKKGKSVTITRFFDRSTRESSEAEEDANIKATVALFNAMQYYGRHHRISDAYVDVKKVAREHWHPDIADGWARYFHITSGETQINIPDNLRVIILRELKRLDAEEDIVRAHTKKLQRDAFENGLN